MMETVFNNPWVRAAGLVLALILSAFILYLLSPVLIPLFFAFLVAYVLDPIVDVFEKRHISRTVTIACFAILGLGLLLAVPLYFVPGFIHQADELISVAGAGLERSGGVTGFFYDLIDRLPLDTLVKTLGWEPEGGEDFDPLSVLTMELTQRIKEPAVQYMKSNVAQLAAAGQSTGTGIGHAVASLGRGIVGFLMLLGNFVLFGFVAAYLLRDFDGIVATVKELVPHKYRPTTFRVGAKIDSQIRGFLRGQMVVCACLGTMYAIGLFLSGVPFAFLLGAFGAVASFIPYLGLVLTIGPAVVLCFVQHQGLDGHMLGVLGTFMVAQTLEGTVLTPKIVGDQVGLGPVWVMLAILVFGNALGFLGLLLAIPLAASLKVIVEETVTYYKASPVFGTEQDAGERRAEKESG